MNTDLILQINAILDYLQNNDDVMTSDDIISSSSNVLEALSDFIYEESNLIEIEELKRNLSPESFDTYDFCYKIRSLLLKYCCTAYNNANSQKLVLSNEYSALLQKHADLTSYLDKVLRSFEHLVHVRNVYHHKYAVKSDLFTGKGVVYTAITGGYDKILEPLATEDCFDYILLTDIAPKNYHGKWQIRIIDNPQNLSSPLLARWAKMHPFELFPDYDFSIYLDGILQLREEKLTDFIEQYRKNRSMICMPHHCYNNIDEDAAAVVALKKATKDALDEQIIKYRKEGFVDTILIETAVLVRSHKDPLLKKVMDDWWTELTSYRHHRDQMSFCYVCWKNNYEFDITDLQSHSNPWTIAYHVH